MLKHFLELAATRTHTVTSLPDRPTRPGAWRSLLTARPWALMLHGLCCFGNVTLFLRNLPGLPLAFQVRSKDFVMEFQSLYASRQTPTTDQQTLLVCTRRSAPPAGSLPPPTLSTSSSSQPRRFSLFFSPNTSLQFFQILLCHWIPQTIRVNTKSRETLPSLQLLDCRAPVS